MIEPPAAALEAAAAARVTLVLGAGDTGKTTLVTGLAAALLFLMLLAISNDLSLRALKTKRWKSLQRWTYVAFVLTAAHGIVYQLIEKRHVPWVLVFGLVIAWVAAGQFLGFVQFRRGLTLSP